MSTWKMILNSFLILIMLMLIDSSIDNIYSGKKLETGEIKESSYVVLMDDGTVEESDSCYEKNGNKVCEINGKKLFSSSENVVVKDYWDSNIEKEDGCNALLSDGTVEESDFCYERNGYKICRVFGNRFGETIVVEDYWKSDDSNDD